MISRIMTVLLVLTSVTACSNLTYYRQAALGQMELLSARRDFKVVLADQAVPEAVKIRLKLVEEILSFAETEIGLPVGDTFSTYADIGRPFVVWNVFVAQPYSIQLETFCFPIAGCVIYKGFFSREDAQVFSEEQEKTGFETYIGGVAAYSSLGWFSDPVLNTFIHRSDENLAALIFHELAHKLVYFEDDTAFNESFAVTVERYALGRWLDSRNQSAAYIRYLGQQERQASVIELILESRVTLSKVYKSEVYKSKVYISKVYESNVPEGRGERKAEVIQSLRDDYATLRHRWHDAGIEANEFEFWMEQDINNAKLGAIGAYQTWVNSLMMLLSTSVSFSAFIQKVQALEELTPGEREAFLLEL